MTRQARTALGVLLFAAIPLLESSLVEATDAGGNFDVQILHDNTNVIGGRLWLNGAGPTSVLIVVRNQNHDSSVGALNPTADQVVFGLRDYEIEPKVVTLLPAAGYEGDGLQKWKANTGSNGGAPGADYARWVPETGNPGLSGTTPGSSSDGETGFFPLSLQIPANTQPRTQSWSVSIRDDFGRVYGYQETLMRLSFDAIRPRLITTFTDGTSSNLALYHSESTTTEGISFLAADETTGSGLTAVNYTATNGAAVPANQSFSVDAEGYGSSLPVNAFVPLASIPEGTTVYTIKARDAAGNLNTSSVRVRMDRAPPISGPITVVANNGGSGWYTSVPSQIRLNVSDALAGVEKLTYRWTGSAGDTVVDNPPAVIVLTHPQTGFTDGSHTLTMHAEDLAHPPNVEAPRTFSIHVDTTAPLLLAGLASAEDSPSSLLKLVARDVTSGLHSIAVRADGATEGVCEPFASGVQRAVNCTLPLASLSEGSHGVTLTATDVAGHASFNEYSLYVSRSGESTIRLVPPPGTPPPRGNDPSNSPSGGVGLSLSAVGNPILSGLLAGSTTPLRVLATDLSGNPVGGLKIAWSVNSDQGQATVAPLSSVTGNDGTATATLTTDPTPSTNVVAATTSLLPGNPLYFTISTSTPARIEPVQASFTGLLVGTSQRLQARVTDAAGEPVSGVRVGWTASPTNRATLSQGAVITDALGLASVEVTPRSSGTLQIHANASGLPRATFTLTAKTASPSGIDAAPSGLVQAIEAAGNVSLPENSLFLVRLGTGSFSLLNDTSGTLVVVRSIADQGIHLLQVRHTGELLLVRPATNEAFPVAPAAGVVGHDELQSDATRRVEVHVADKTGWILVSLIDPHPTEDLLGVGAPGGRGLPRTMAWRDEEHLFFLDDPAATYVLEYQSAASPTTGGPPLQSTSGFSTLLPILIALGVLVVAIGAVIVALAMRQRNGAPSEKESQPPLGPSRP